MSTLSSKSAQEISEMLDDYGIKHGPVVDSTRSLYEKRLKCAMGKETKLKPSPDKTYYREEEEEVTYVTYRTPLRSEGSGDRKSYMRSKPEYTEKDFVDEKPYSRSRVEYSERDYAEEKPYSRQRMEYSGREYAEEPHAYDTPSSYRSVSYSKPAAMKSGGGDCLKEAPGSTRLIPLWVQFLVFLLVAVFLYIVFANMESTVSDPFKKLN